MGRLGFEPRTSRLKAECSTTELATPLLRLEGTCCGVFTAVFCRPRTGNKCSTHVARELNALASFLKKRSLSIVISTCPYERNYAPRVLLICCYTRLSASTGVAW